MDKYKITIDTYNKSAEMLAMYFAGIGPRVIDIDKALELTGQPSSTLKVVEIGCGDGRDAAEIVERVGNYEGFDLSSSLLEIARQRLPGVSFKEANALTYQYPNNLDLCIAFASLLHVPRDDLGKVFQKIHKSLRLNGILYISLKERPDYTEELQEDKFGERMFYYYNPGVIETIASGLFIKIHEDHQIIGKTEWFTVAMKKYQ